ncbi:MAG TPA: hypothetical protein EYQ18_16780 [Candidatus Handelsmanbacteria bacterium]|nr:hypothetical protein [Candidatus Handelsmanbacteria bacterium]
MRQGDPERAEIYLRKAIAHTPMDDEGILRRYRKYLGQTLALRGDTSRLLYRAVAWYQQMEAQLKSIDGDWESWTRGVFSFLRREEGQTHYWTVCGLDDGPFSHCTQQVERDGVLQQSVTFVVPNVSSDSNDAKPQSRGERILVDAYQDYYRRLQRILRLLRHLQVLGMRSTQEYRGWFTSRGLADELLKSPPQRRREVELMGSQNKPSGGAWFRGVAARIYRGQHREADLQTEFIGRIARAFDKGLAGGARRAYLDLLLLAEERAKLFGLQAAISRMGPFGGNVFVEALANLARNYRHWIRPLDEWTPISHDPRQQFSSLVRHLLAQYPVPIFMDSAWCRGRKAIA